MCWTGLKNECIRKVAEDNIPVTKIVKIENNNNDILSYFNVFKYEIGKVYKTNIHFEYSFDTCYITKGFHSYINEQLEKTTEGIVVKLSNRLGMYYNRNLINIRCGLGILSCVIPKGAIYYQNKAGEAVSDTIKPIYFYKIK